MDNPKRMGNDTLIWKFTAFCGATGEERVKNYKLCLAELERRGFDCNKVTMTMDRAVARLAAQRPDPTAA